MNFQGFGPAKEREQQFSQSAAGRRDHEPVRLDNPGGGRPEASGQAPFTRHESRPSLDVCVFRLVSM